MQSQKDQLIHSLNEVLNPEFYKGISQLIIELMIFMPNFHRALDNELLEYIYDNVSKRRCDLKNYSHLSKHKVDAFLARKNPRVTIDVSEKKKKKKNTGELFHEFLEKLYDVCKKHPDMSIPISGKHFVTFQSMFDQSGLGNSGYAQKAAREALINAGYIEMAGTKYIKFVSKVPKPHLNNQEDTIRQISNTIYRYISTQFQNIEAHKNDSLVLMEKSMMSNTIPEKHREACFQELRRHFESPFFSGKDILEKYEDNNSEKTHARGYQVFFFNTDL